MKYETLDKELYSYFKSQYPNEGVAFIKDGKIIPMKNEHTSPVDSFMVDAKYFMEIDPDGIAHSHPTGDVTPSEDDILLKKTTGVDIGIYGVNPKTKARCIWI